MSKLFISHSSKVNPKALAIRQWLQIQGWDDVFLDLDPERGLVMGDCWEQALLQSLRQLAASCWCLRAQRHDKQVA